MFSLFFYSVHLTLNIYIYFSWFSTNLNIYSLLYSLFVSLNDHKFANYLRKLTIICQLRKLYDYKRNIALHEKEKKTVSN